MWLVILRNCLHFVSIKWKENHSSHSRTSNRTKRLHADGDNQHSRTRTVQPQRLSALNVMLSMTSTFVLRKGIFYKSLLKVECLYFLISLWNQFGQTNDNDIFFIHIRPLFTISLLALTVVSDDVYYVFQEKRTNERKANNVNS